MNALTRQFQQDLSTWARRVSRGEVPVCCAPEDPRFAHAEGLPVHGHPELFLQLDGQTRFRFPRGQFLLRSGQLCIVPIGVPHGEIALDGPKPFRTLVLMYMGHALGCLYGRASANRVPVAHSLQSFAPVDPLLVGGLLKQARRLARERNRQQDAGLVMGALMEITLRALQHPLSDRPGASWSSLVRLCHELIQQRFTSSICNVAWLARELGCTPNYLSLTFSRQTGETLTECLHRLRMRRARDLLETTQLKVVEITQACGYGHPSYFIARFREQFGSTPRHYRISVTQ